MSEQQGIVIVNMCRYCGMETNTISRSQEDADEEVSICDPCYGLHIGDDDE